ncbi:uncharacterized protein DSM5745_07167 [Aspergillus mulundensis]|uniref:Uncharacterized protein n=1 Tax=Aspergillus mulundensis TaxID=1810919 RepID=A0A3D8RKD3_9EURO|nr:Uncharacterized protein DSM5745_07167 [Aspergillus mulundensis]RDW74505.1 Uncharacterized protein DSM5745_07167 [Aspergillus mulundensis]
MAPETCEVPIMLDLEGMTYEDIVKLNPFYEEYRTFWDDPRDASDVSLCNDSLSSSSSLPSITSGSDFPSPSIDMATSPSFRIKPIAHGALPRSPKVTFHGGGQFKPTYDEHHELESSQVAIVDDEEFPKRALSPVRECSDDDELVDTLENPFSSVRSSHKQLFGSKGWLGCTADLEAPLPKKPKYRSLVSLGKKFKQHVEGIAIDMVKAHPILLHVPRQSKFTPTSTCAVSLDAAAQSKLYSEMEMMICVSANQFLIQEHAGGRVSEESINKINKFWASKNRPGVVEFLYDQATQRQLILSNIRTLHFNGESSTNPVALHSNLHNWKAVVKEMSVRTFCAPDSVIRKHMHDIQKLLDMLGAPLATFLAFEELQMRTLVWMKEQRARRYLAEGGRTISPSTSFSSR